MSSMFERAYTVLGGLGLGGILTYLGTRYAAKKTAEPGMAMADVELRKLTLEQMKEILVRHDNEIQGLGTKLEKSQEDLKVARKLLKLALMHIGAMRRDMREARVLPPDLPIELHNINLPWDIDMYEV